MVKRLDSNDRDILQFRPNIDHVEPEALPQTITPQTPDTLQLEDVEDRLDRIRRLANAVDLLAAGVQARADEKAKDMVITLDPNVDYETIQAMRRKFPEADPTQITYAQYREAKDDIRDYGLEVGRQAIVTPDQVASERDRQNTNQLGGFGTEEARTGALRPELQNNVRIIQPLNVEKFQIDMICILVNFIWKNFIKPIFKPISLPPGVPFAPSLADLLPDTLCDPGIPYELPGLFILGNDVPELLKGEGIPEIPLDVSEIL